MCGRFAQCSDPDALAQAFGLETVELELSPRYNLAPIQPVLAVRLHPPPIPASPVMSRPHRSSEA